MVVRAVGAELLAWESRRLLAAGLDPRVVVRSERFESIPDTLASKREHSAIAGPQGRAKRRSQRTVNRSRARSKRAISDVPSATAGVRQPARSGVAPSSASIRPASPIIREVAR
jgi:hypothetical protein